MPHADSLSLLHTEEDWCEVDGAWRLDIDPRDWQVDQVRVSMLGANELRWSSPAGSGSVKAVVAGRVSVSIAMSQDDLLTLTTPASQNAPSLLWAQALALPRHGVTAQTLPTCGQKAALRTPSKPVTRITPDMLIKLAGTSDTSFIEAAARSLLIDDSDTNALAVLQVLAQVARNRTPDGLIDLMAHIGSGKGNTTL